jgi:hypothetical protein
MNMAVDDDLAAMEVMLTFMLNEIAVREMVKLNGTTSRARFVSLIGRLHKKYGQMVAILIDEYDAPIVRHILDPAKADGFRGALATFYGLLKTSVDMIGHVFLTGVSRFTKASIFPELNNLEDLTLDSEFATICGLTETDLEDILADQQDRTLAAMIENGVMPQGSTGADLRQLIKNWYYGYSWDGKTRVYNPWSVFLSLKKAEIASYWYMSGSPTFLIELLRSKKIHYNFSQKSVEFNAEKNAIDSISDLNSAALMFQAGYLTIKERLPGTGIRYNLALPNLEVEAALIPLKFSIEPPRDALLASQMAKLARDRLLNLDARGLEEAFGGYLGAYTFHCHFKYEKHYHVLFEVAMMMAKQPCEPRKPTAYGLMDFQMIGPKGDMYIIELKLLKEPKNKRGEEPTPPDEPNEIAKLRATMSPLARKALNQIGQKYVNDFTDRPIRVIKVALVIARRSFVLAEFEELVSTPRR